MTMSISIDPTISIHRFDREARRALAGVFETTPKGLSSISAASRKNSTTARRS